MAHVKVNITDKLKAIAKQRNITPEELVINYVAFSLTMDEWTGEESRIVIEKHSLHEEANISIGVKQLKKKGRKPL